MEIAEQLDQRQTGMRFYECSGETFRLTYVGPKRLFRVAIIAMGDRWSPMIARHLGTFHAIYTDPMADEWERIEPLAFEAIRRHMGQLTLTAMQEL